MKKLFSKTVLIIVVSALVLALAGCGGSSSSSSSGSSSSSSTSDSSSTSAPQITLQLGHVNPGKEEDNLHHMCLTFSDKLNELSNGAIKVDVVGDSQLGSEREVLEGMQMGTVDMALNVNSSVGAMDPEFQIFDFPYLFENRDQVYAVYDDEEIMKPLTDKLYDEYGIKFLAAGDNGFRSMLNNVRPINTVDDLKGLKIRLMENAIQSDCFKAFGASPTTMVFSEVYTACQQGTVDGFELPIASTFSGAYWAVIKYSSLTEHLYTPLYLMMSRTTWESLSAEQQEWVMEAAEVAKQENRRYIQEKESEWLAEMAKHMEVNTVEDKSSFVEAARSIYPTYTAQIGEEIVNRIQEKIASVG